MYIDIILKSKPDNFYPDIIPERLLKKPMPYKRMGEIVDILKENATGLKGEDFRPQEAEKYTGLYRLYGIDYYCFTYNPKEKEFSEFVFEKIDSNRHWTITQNPDGAEHIHYFEKGERYEVKDEETGYGVFI